MNVQNQFHIHPARSLQDIDTATALITSYATSLGIDLSYQDFNTEISQMPGNYSPQNGGELLLALKGIPTNAPHPDNRSCGCDCTYTDPDVLGCIALRALSPRVCEVKRLYTRPQARRLGIGRALIDAVIGVARAEGYVEMRLDTLPSMRGAIALYKSRGFEEIEAYYDSKVPEM
ncbi:conserved hypothetical protein [Uncinocarpus reesii 1704]|uniref:N-acetyltransferase domain-containing protein n=1 Tax=Uncinocarpus reesii (strain UAMH 1704) TaxID=336963 RepID=C4JWJ3_UNCRE|nr:uncharacterized protein UREG_06935 [Uncinocarpus reesii 1704]EEP82070.1 conserved hypothetical protein [Uncinocarpus reesii 1704]